MAVNQKSQKKMKDSNKQKAGIIAGWLAVSSLVVAFIVLFYHVTKGQIIWGGLGLGLMWYAWSQIAKGNKVDNHIRALFCVVLILGFMLLFGVALRYGGDINALLMAMAQSDNPAYQPKVKGGWLEMFMVLGLVIAAYETVIPLARFLQKSSPKKETNEN